MSAFYFGPLGSMVPLVVSAGVPVQTGRGFSEFVSSGGVRYVQAGRAAPRTWTVGRQWQDPEWVRLLSMAAHGMLPDCWLYDVAAARDNMLPAGLSAGSGGPAVPVGGIALGPLAVGHTVRVPVLAGRSYSVSAWCADDAPILTYQHGAETGTVEAVAGSGSTSIMPMQDLILEVKVARAGVSGLRINEGSFDGTFHPGFGTPCRVAVQDPARTLQLVTGDVRSDYEATLYEVGKPGTI